MSYIDIIFQLLDVEVQSCQVTSNVSNNSNTAVVDLHERFIINCSSTQRNGSNVTFEIWPPYGMGLTGSKKYIWHFKKSILYFVDVKSSSGGKLTCKIKQNNSVEESCDFTVIVKGMFVYIDLHLKYVMFSSIRIAFVIKASSNHAPSSGK